MTLLERLDRAWTRLEVALVVLVCGGLAASLVAWVALKGLASPTTDTFYAGLALRALLSAVTAGAVAWRVKRSSAVTTGVMVLAAALAWAWLNAGVAYFGNLFGWLQDGSLLTWLGGLRGLATRLTLLLALLGASLATASGRHVAIDVATRALGERARAVFDKLGALLAAFVCLVAAWGFFDFTAVDAFDVSPQASATAKVSQVAAGVGRHARLAVAQWKLDLHLAGRVLRGQPWNQSLTGAEWNAFLEESGEPELLALREANPSAWRTPLLAPAGGAARGFLVKSFNLVLPLGLLFIAARFLLWVLRGAPREGAPGEAAAPEAPLTEAAS
jgi:hypothetical protein